MPNPWIILALVVAWIVSIAAVGKWQNDAGHTAERSIAQAQALEDAEAANKRILELESAARLAEHAHAEAVNDIATGYEGDIHAANEKVSALVAAVRDGALRLSDPGRRQDPCRGGSAEAAPCAGQCDGQAGGELSGKASEFLLGEAGRADKIVKQLAACQRIVEDDRR